MPFLFSYVCDLLQRLDDNRHARSGLRSSASIIQDWFRGHQGLLHRDDHNTAALLSALLPEKRTDRVCFIREKKLQTIIGRALGLGRSRIAQLGRWSNPEAHVDLADCVESILRETPNPVSPTHRAVTVDEIDQVLHSIASTCRFSSPTVRSSVSENRPADKELALGDLYKRLSARDAKWLTRLILKNYEPVILNQQVVYSSCHPLLPAILKVQDDLSVAGRILDTQRRNRTVTGSDELASYLKPALGVKIGRQTWIKGRSIKHSLSMLQGRVSCEEKMDGEYCQIHIDLSKGYQCIQIFSKSGKDSTKDRLALHDSIRKSLQLGQPSCPLKTGCILEGELVVYSDKDSKILDFHKIRKHVSRSGSFLGTDKDSQPHPWEHLMIVYYDVLMVDNESLLAVEHSERFRRLKELIREVPGRSALVRREVIDCTRRSATSDLRRAFAKCITARGEGLVLKADDPFFDFGTTRRPYSCCAIKLKKEYIGHFGDIGDFAVVGARFDAAKARTYNIPRLKWTHFYVGCLENKEEVQRFGKQPRFVVTNVVQLNATQLEAFSTSVNPEAVRPEDNTAISLRIEPGIDNGQRPSAIFVSPPVFDLRCFSFDKEGNTGFWSPRFPSVSKIHCDRTYHDALSFDELQEMAVKEKEAPAPEDSQELLSWIASLEQSEPNTGHDTTSQSTVCTTTGPWTPSPRAVRVNGRLDSLTPTSPTSPTRGKGRPPPAQLGAPRITGPLTPPRSSAIQAPDPTPAEGVNMRGGAVLARKRPSEASTQTGVSERRKIRRCSGDSPGANVIHASSRSDQSGPSTSQRISSAESEAGVSREPTEASVSAPVLSRSLSLPHPNPAAKPPSSRDAIRPSLRTALSLPEGPLPSHPPTTTSRPIATHPSHDTTTVLNTTTSTAGAQASDLTTATPLSDTRQCRFLGDACPLAGYSVLLSPCIADFPWVTQDLLACHGVVEFVRDPRAWPDGDGHRVPSSALCTPTTAATATTTTTATSTAPSGSPEPAPHNRHHTTPAPAPAPSTTTTDDSGNRTRRHRKNKKTKKKLILVDARRREATVAFLQTVEAVQLRRPARDGGGREYVPVYDWRVLEDLRAEEEEEERERERRRGGGGGGGGDGGGKGGGEGGDEGRRRRGDSIGSGRGLWRRFFVGLA